MFSLISVLLISCSTYFSSFSKDVLNSNFDNNSLNSIVVDEIDVKNAFVNVGTDDTVFLYTVTDLCSQDAFLDFRDYFYQNSSITLDNELTINTYYGVDIGGFWWSWNLSNFDYAGGYPYGLSRGAGQITYLRASLLSNADYFRLRIEFCDNSSVVSNGGKFCIDYYVSENFDYVINAIPYLSSYSAPQNTYSYNRFDYSNYCVIGSSTDYINVQYPLLSDVLKRVGDRGFDQNSYNEGYSYGYNDGYNQGYDDALVVAYPGVANEIFSGIFSIALLPVNVFLNIFNFEVFGINISGLVTGLLTTAMVVIILRFIFGGSKGSDGSDK